jgi:putative Holliday junction resolvase
MDGTLGSSAQSAKDLSLNLSKNISIPITMWDERLSSQGSFNIMRNMSQNISGKRKLLDQNAAAFILQGFLDFLNK